MSVAVTMLQDKRGGLNTSKGRSILFSAVCEGKTLKSNLISADFDLIDTYFPLLRAVYNKTINIKVSTILAQLVSGHGLCTKLLSVDLICCIGARALDHTCVALFLKLCELYDDRIAVIDMNDRRKGCKDEAVEAVAVSKRRVDEAVEKLRKAILERRTNPTMFRSPDTSISTDTDHSQSMEAQEDNPPLVLVWKSILRELGVGGKTGACDEISRKLACMTTREENQEDAFIDARLVLEARQALMASLVVTGEKPEVKSLTASFANLTRKQTVHVPVRSYGHFSYLQNLWAVHILQKK